MLSLHDVPEHIYCKGSFVSKFYIPSSFLRPGIYTLGLGSHSLKDEYSWNDSMFDFEVIEMFDDLNDKRDFGMINIKPFSKTERKKL